MGTADLPEWVHNLHTDESGISRTLAAGLEAEIFVGENTMLSVVTIEPNAEGELHSHPEEQWGVLIEGECIRVQDGEEYHATAGDFWHTPGGAEHTIRTGESGALVLDIFSPPRPEYRDEGSGFATDSTE
jgi:quercetin dioxygenase-like cupin family protein